MKYFQRIAFGRLVSIKAFIVFTGALVILLSLALHARRAVAVEPQVTASKKVYLPAVTTWRDRSQNKPPVAVDDTFTVREDTPTDLPVVQNDTDPDRDSLGIAHSTHGQYGVVVRPAYGTTVRYEPRENYIGRDSFSYWVTDGLLQSEEALVALTIVPVNDPPVALDDRKQAIEDLPLSFPTTDLLANDSVGPAHESGQQRQVTAVTAGTQTHGAVTLTSGTVRYMPAANFVGDASFTYTICDNGTTAGQADPKCDAGTVIVEVRPVNDAPSFTKGSNQVVGEDSGAHVARSWAQNISVGPANESGQAVAFVLSHDNRGLFAEDPTVDSAGTLRYKLAPDVVGKATVTLYAHDSGGGDAADSPSQSFTITVTEVNDPITVFGEAMSTWEQTALSIMSLQLTGNDAPGPWNEASQRLTLTKVTRALDTHGSLTWTNGTISYVPETNYNGPASFTYEVCDNGTTNGVATPQCATGIVSITVRPVNDPPSFQKGPDRIVAEDSGVNRAHTMSGWAQNMSVGPSNESDQTFYFVVVPDNPNLFAVDPTVDVDGTLHYTLAPNANGKATMMVKMHDNGGTANGGVADSAIQTFTITITEVNDAPAAAEDARPDMQEDEVLSFPAAELLIDDLPGPSNENGQQLQVTAVAAGTDTHGSVVLNNGTITYTPVQNYFGAASFSYTICDNGTTRGLPDPLCDTDTVRLWIQPVND